MPTFHPKILFASAIALFVLAACIGIWSYQILALDDPRQLSPAFRTFGAYALTAATLVMAAAFMLGAEKKLRYGMLAPALLALGISLFFDPFDAERLTSLQRIAAWLVAWLQLGYVLGLIYAGRKLLRMVERQWSPLTA